MRDLKYPFKRCFRDAIVGYPSFLEAILAFKAQRKPERILMLTWKIECKDSYNFLKHTETPELKAQGTVILKVVSFMKNWVVVTNFMYAPILIKLIASPSVMVQALWLLCSTASAYHKLYSSIDEGGFELCSIASAYPRLCNSIGDGVFELLLSLVKDEVTNFLLLVSGSNTQAGVSQQITELTHGELSLTALMALLKNKNPEVKQPACLGLAHLLNRNTEVVMEDKDGRTFLINIGACAVIVSSIEAVGSIVSRVDDDIEEQNTHQLFDNMPRQDSTITCRPTKKCIKRTDWLELPYDITANILHRLGAIEILESAPFVTQEQNTHQLFDNMPHQESTITRRPTKKCIKKTDWLELPYDITANILRRLGAIEILESVQKVCTSWRNICKDPVMWRVIDMHIPKDLFCHCLPYEKMFMHAVDRSQGQLLDINIEYFGSYKWMEYLTEGERSTQLRRIRIVYGHGRLFDFWTEFMKKAPLLEEIDLTYTEIPEETIANAGKYHPMLKSFKYNWKGYKRCVRDAFLISTANDFVKCIAKGMPQLRHLQLIGSDMSNEGLQAILDGCPQLESLDLRACFNINLDKSSGKLCVERIKYLRLPRESLEDYKFNKPKIVKPIYKFYDGLDFEVYDGDDYDFEYEDDDDDSEDNDDKPKVYNDDDDDDLEIYDYEWFRSDEDDLRDK